MPTRRADDDLDDDEIELIKKHRAKKGAGRTVRVWEVPEEMFEKMFGTDDDGDDDDGDDDDKKPDEGAGKKRKGWFD